MKTDLPPRLLVASMLVVWTSITLAQQPETPTAPTPGQIKSAETQLKTAWRNLAADRANPTGPALQQKVAKEIRESREAEAKKLQEAWRNLGRTPAGSGTLEQNQFRVQKSPTAPGAKAEGIGEPFANPDEIPSKNGVLTATLNLKKVLNRLGGVPVLLRSYNGKLVGPTLRARPGDTLHITLNNQLEPELDIAGSMNTLHAFNVTNLHTHGLHVSPAGISDNVLLEVGPHSTQEYEIVIPKDHPCGTFWYHPHRHGSTAAQVASGVSGALIIEGDMDNIPALAKAQERIFVLQQIAYYQASATSPGVIEEQYEGSIFPPGSWDKLGRYTSINGQVRPVLTVRPGSVERWRLIDSGIREPMYLRLVALDEKDNPIEGRTVPLAEIALDGLPLGKAVTPQTVLPASVLKAAGSPQAADVLRGTVELWPGYRSDVLVKAPDSITGRYALRDERPGNNMTNDRRNIAIINFAGTPTPMALPTDQEMAPFRLKSLPVPDPNNTQTSIYGIQIDGQGIKFTMNNMPFDGNTARKLTLGQTDTWTLQSINQVGYPGGVSHPFHIHVNPFEVTSIKDRDGNETLTTGPVWRDTIILNEGWQVTMRTQYTDFPGVFVQHCHILDHEDQGMMELVEVISEAPNKQAAAEVKPIRVATPYAAPAWKLADAAGKQHGLEEFKGRPTALVFFEGYECSRCAVQIRAFEREAAAFAAKNINVVGISSRALAAQNEEDKSPFTVLADPSQEIFRRYGCYSEGPLHGIFLLDAKGMVRWQTIGTAPFMDISMVLDELSNIATLKAPMVASSGMPASALGLAVAPAALAPTAAAAIPQEPAARVEVEIRNTPAEDDDYITWAPTPARIHLVPGAGVSGDVKVVLTNDPPQPIPAGRTVPLDGDLVFDATVAPGKTATQDTLALTLPKSGAWVPFYVAGKFGRPSSADKDAILQVHAGTADGAVLGQQAMMVRVRKDHRTLTDHERDRFLEALDYLQRGTVDANGDSRYMYFVKMHRAAAWGIRPVGGTGPAYYWPDLAHKAPGFIAWHRAFLLEFEREIQKNYPDVALPYWVMPEKSNLFAQDFMGANDVVVDDSGDSPPQAAVFSPNNPLFGWTADIDGAENEPIQRFSAQRVPGAAHWNPGSSAFATDASLLANPVFSRYPKRPDQGAGFAEEVESNPHNGGHNWTGPWMQNCATSPRDPIFWVFHCGFDRQWAAWQAKYGKYDPTGSDGSFCPLGTFEASGEACGQSSSKDCNNTARNGCVPITHHVADKLWPWSSAFGQAATKKGSLPQEDMAKPFRAPFPSAPLAGLWPASPAQPTPGDMIDYLGVNEKSLPMGFCYDDTIYPSAKSSPPAPPPVLAATSQLKFFADKKRPLTDRLLSLKSVVGVHPMTASDLDGLASAVQSVDEHHTLRSQALKTLNTANVERGIEESLKVLKSPAADAGSMGSSAVDVLSQNLMFSQVSETRSEEIMMALEGALKAASAKTRSAALRALTSMGPSAEAQASAIAALASPQSKTFTAKEAIKGLVLMQSVSQNAAVIRPFLKDADADTRREAVLALSKDADSRSQIEAIALDNGQPRQVRSAAIHSLMATPQQSVDVYTKLIQNATTDKVLKAEAIATLGVLVRSVQVDLGKDGFTRVIDLLSNIPALQAEAIGPIVAKTIHHATLRLKASSASGK